MSGIIIFHFVVFGNGWMGPCVPKVTLGLAHLPQPQVLGFQECTPVPGCLICLTRFKQLQDRKYNWQVFETQPESGCWSSWLLPEVNILWPEASVKGQNQTGPEKVTERLESWLSAKSRRSRFWDQFPAPTSRNSLLPVIPIPRESDALFKSRWVLQAHGAPCRQNSHTQKIKKVGGRNESKTVHRPYTVEVPSHLAFITLMNWGLSE